MDLAGYPEIIRSFSGGLELPPKLTTSEWADRYRMLSPEASAEPGRWRTDRAPFQREIMDTREDPTVNHTVIMASSQVGKTEILLNMIAKGIHANPGPMMIVQPNVKPMGEAWSKDRLAPMIRDTPVLTSLVKEVKSRDSENTILHKRFPGGHLTVGGANSPAGLASRPIRDLFLDEVDRFPASAGTEGDPVKLAEKRTKTFWNRFIGEASTPTLKGASRIAHSYERSDKRLWFVPCPDCGKHQVLKWEQVRWDKTVKDGKKVHHPETAAYVCEYCGSCWSDVVRWQAVKRGEWRATAPFNGVAGFHLSELISPWGKLAEMASEYLEAKKLPDLEQVWVNTTLGETWEIKGEQADATGLMDRREHYGPGVPDGVGILTAGVDVQDDRLEALVSGWGVDEEAWHVDRAVLPGDPQDPALWDELLEYLIAPFPRESGGALTVQATCVDTGGHHTDAVYQFCKKHWHRRIFAIKGQAGVKPIWTPTASRKNKANVPLYSVGVDTAKNALIQRLKITEPGPGYLHFPVAVDQEYFDQLTAEKAVLVKQRNGFSRREWHKTRDRNEVWDLWVYGLAALKSRLVARVNLARAVARAASLNGEPIPERILGSNDNSPPKPARKKRNLAALLGGNQPAGPGDPYL